MSESGWERPGDPKGFMPFAEAGDLAEPTAEWLSFKSLITSTAMDLLYPRANSRYLAIEYKDNLISPRLDPYESKGDGPKCSHRQPS